MFTLGDGNIILLIKYCFLFNDIFYVDSYRVDPVSDFFERLNLFSFLLFIHLTCFKSTKDKQTEVSVAENHS